MARAQRHIAPARLPENDKRLTVIIPAAGIGKRMKSLGPKILLPVSQQQSILEKQIRVIHKIYPHADIIVVAGFQHHKVRKLRSEFDFRMVLNNDYENTNVTHSVAIGLDASLAGPVLIMHGDLVFNTMCIAGLAGKHSSLLINPDRHMSKDEVGVAHTPEEVTNLSYGLPILWGQMVFVRDKELRLLKQAVFNYDLSSQWFLWEALNYIIDKKGVFVPFYPGDNAKLVEVDSPRDLKNAVAI